MHLGNLSQYLLQVCADVQISYRIEIFPSTPAVGKKHKRTSQQKQLYESAIQHNT